MQIQRKCYGQLQRRCHVCGETVLFMLSRGWVHEGGGTMMMRCGRCGLRAAPFPVPIACPDCSERVGWRPDHIALPAVPQANVARETYEAVR